MTPFLKKLGITLYVIHDIEDDRNITSLDEVSILPDEDRRVAKATDLDCDLHLHVFSTEREAHAFGAGMDYINDDSIHAIVEHRHDSPHYVLLSICEDSDDVGLTVFDHRENVSNSTPEKARSKK